jgi:hypothetical protein
MRFLDMAAPPYTPPAYALKAFNCPFCGAFAKQHWLPLTNHMQSNSIYYDECRQFHFCWCEHCSRVSTWYDHAMIIPDSGAAPLPHPDMPTDISEDFAEARSVLQRSPRAAAALLRLCLQKLCKELGEPGENINADIASLVKKGLPVEVQQSLDIVRVIGNEQVHPGQLDVRDDPALAAELFVLINFIVDDRISRPKAIRELYSRLPPNKLEGIRNRDG